MSPILRKLLGERITCRLECYRFFAYDRMRFLRYSGCFAFNADNKYSSRAKIVRYYHIVEKGLTMPNRHLAFGVEVVKTLLKLIGEFENLWGVGDSQVEHAVAVVLTYRNLHVKLADEVFADNKKFWSQLCEFCNRHSMSSPSYQLHMTFEEFYSHRRSEFPDFARARHVVRHYSSKQVDIEDIKCAVDIANTAPTACNRQHCHVYCVTDKGQMKELLDMQGGSRGFGHLADKLLVVTSDLACTVDIRERNDAYTNGGLFVMQLCNALYYYKIGYCILNWTQPPKNDVKIRKILPLRPSEEVIVLLTCGVTPLEFDVAASPRRNVSEVFTVL